ncbi:hypothetical protein ACEPAH_4178 [Sanghuangporus vaninii]
MSGDLTASIVQSLRSRNIPELDYSTFTREDAVFSNGVRAVLTKGRLLVDDLRGRREKVVVLKTINPEFSRKADTERKKKLVQYFEREAGIWRLTCGHPNILKLYGFVTIPGQIFPSLISPYYERDLRAFVERHDILSAKQRLKFTSDIARGLAFLHSLSPLVIHRDIRASNSLVKGDGFEYSAMIIDFGSSKISDPDLFKVLKSTQSGSYAWAPPEYTLFPDQYTNPTTHGDIWSLECTCLEIFTAKDPYRGYDVEEAHKNGLIPDRPTGLQIEINDATWEFLKKCWNRCVDQRPSAGDATSEFERLSTNA